MAARSAQKLQLHILDKNVLITDCIPIEVYRIDAYGQRIEEICVSTSSDTDHGYCPNEIDLESDPGPDETRDHAQSVGRVQPC